MLYFISDLHFGHENVLKYCERPFSCVEDMDKTLIGNWNSKISDADDVYILGDFTLKRGEYVKVILSQLKGKKHLIRGNHDYFLKDYSDIENPFVSISDYKELSYQSTRFILCHYPFVEWNKFYHAAIHLHGHQHNKPEYNIENRKNHLLRYDVGVDANYMYPTSAESIIKFFSPVEIRNRRF